MKKLILRLGAIATTTVPFIVASCGITKTQKEKDNADIQKVTSKLNGLKNIKVEFEAGGNAFGDTVKQALIDKIDELISGKHGCGIEVTNKSTLTKRTKGSIEIQVSKGAGTVKTTELSNVLWSKTEGEVAKDDEDIKAVADQLKSYETAFFEFECEGTDFNKKVKRKLIEGLNLEKSKKCKIEVIGKLNKEQRGSIEIQVSKGAGTVKTTELSNVLWSKTGREVEKEKDDADIKKVTNDLLGFSFMSIEVEVKGEVFNNEIKNKIINKIISDYDWKTRGCIIEFIGKLIKNLDNDKIIIKISKGIGTVIETKMSSVCWKDTKDEQKIKEKNSILKVKREILAPDKISFRSTATTLDEVKEDLRRTFITNSWGCSIDILGTLVKEKQATVTFKISRGGQKTTIDKTIIWTDLDAKKERYTIYKIGTGEEIISKNHDLLSIKDENITITQIGYKYQIIDNFPAGTIFVPAKLPIYINSIKDAFKGCKKFNQDLNWDVSKVTDMSSMFDGCLKFNQDLNWDVSKVTNMNRMFKGCNNFNRSITNWDTSLVTNMENMFEGCKNFNQDLAWNVSNVKTMFEMFWKCESFNGDITTWKVGEVNNMKSMFHGCLKFNQDLKSWNVSKVTDMSSMFDGCLKFNQDLNWDVSKVIKMVSMFNGCENFNGNITNWNTSLVTNMDNMFSGCKNFTKDLSGWNVKKVTSHDFFADGAPKLKKGPNWNKIKFNKLFI